MQIQINNLDGQLKNIEQQSAFETPQMLIDYAVTRSSDNPGYIVIIGDNLDGGSTQEAAHVIAVNGQLIWQNVLDI